MYMTETNLDPNIIHLNKDDDKPVVIQQVNTTNDYNPFILNRAQELENQRLLIMRIM